MRFKHLFVLALLVSSLKASLTFTLINGDNEYSVTDSSASGSLVIPSTYNGLPVTSIGYRAFLESGLTNITIPDSVTSIAAGAFQACTSLSSITIPSSVTSIGNYAFASCSNLSRITFEGDAPTFGTSVFNESDSVAIYYYNDATGFRMPAFQGRPSQTLIRGNPQFQIIEGRFTWAEATADAESRGGRLAVLNTQARIDAATALVRNDSSSSIPLIGLKLSNSDNNFYWNTGEPLGVQNWDTNQPEDGGEEAVIMYGGAKRWHDVPLNFKYEYLLEILPIEPKAPVLDLETFYESTSGESIIVDATPTYGYPTIYTYQWYFNGFPIPSFLDGTNATYSIDGASTGDGTWRVEVTNDTGTTSVEFEYRVFTDADGDGLSDYRESNIIGTDPNLGDSDSDGLNDFAEVNTHSTNPNLDDTDTDGLSDGDEVNTYSSNPLVSDSDGDGLTDGAEVNTYSTDPNDTDSDDDQLSDADEVNTHLTNPNLSDTDSDQLSDYSEINSHFTDPNDYDSDGDSLSDGAEVNTYSTNPLLEDTTGDGFSDGFVVAQGADPLLDYSAFRTGTVNQIKDLRIGSTIIEVSSGQADIKLTLEETSDLNDWSSATTSEKTFQIDAPPGTRYYRFKLDDYEPTPPNPPVSGYLVFLEATYGANGIYYDVVSILEQNIVDNSISLFIGNNTMGGDPIPGSVKGLRVRYLLGETEFQMSLREGETLTLP